jgi:hypothetical protein
MQTNLLNTGTVPVMVQVFHEENLYSQNYKSTTAARLPLLTRHYATYLGSTPAGGLAKYSAISFSLTDT